MRQKLKRMKSKICTLIVLVSIALSGIAVYAAEGEIHIELEDLQVRNSVRKNVEVRLYQVGTVDKNDRPEFYDIYEIAEYPQTSEELDAAAEQIVQKVADVSFVSAKTGEDGCVSFTGLEKGIYLIVIPEKNPYGTVKPFLVQLPYYEEVNGAMQGPVYTVKASPKASPHKPGHSSSKHSSDDSPQSSGSTPGAPIASPRTGDRSAMEFYLILAALAVISILFIIIDIRRRNS